jgi:hypothetical protein
MQLGQIGCHLRISDVMPDVQVMDQQQIDARQAEALQTVLKAAHHPIVAVIEAVLKLQAAPPKALREILCIVEGAEQPANFGGEHIVGTRPTIERAAKAVLALPAAVPGRRVIVADAGVPGVTTRFVQNRTLSLLAILDCAFANEGMRKALPLDGESRGLAFQDPPSEPA